MAELVDARDLKSLGPKWLCGFNSRPGHHKTGLGKEWPTPFFAKVTYCEAPFGTFDVIAMHVLIELQIR